MNRLRLLWLAKLTLGVGLLVALLLWQDNGRKMLLQLANIRWHYLLPLVGFSFLLIGLSCLKWDLFLREQGVRISLPRLMGLYTIGFFFNHFLPSMFGGDVARGYVLGRQIDSQAQSMASVFLERFTGLLALLTLALGSLVLKPHLIREPAVALAVLLMGGGCLLLAFSLWVPAVGRFFLARLGGKGRSRLAGKAERLHASILYFKDQPKLCAVAMVYSFVFHIFTGLNVYVCALAIGLHPNPMEVVALTPIILLVSSVPLTPNSLGIWEWAFSVYLISAGALPEQGLAVALVLRAKNIAAAIIGGCLFLAERAPAVPAAKRASAVTEVIALEGPSLGQEP